MKIWLDDIRVAPDGFLWIKTAEECVEIVKSGNVTFIDYDNDLGEGHDGYWVASQIERMAMSNKICPISWKIHSDNPCGRLNITAAMTSAERFWEQNANTSHTNDLP